MNFIAQKKRSSATMVILIIATVVLLGAIFVPILLVGAYLGGNMDKAIGFAGPGGSACYLNNDGFSDISIASDIDGIISKLKNNPRIAAQIDKLQTETPDAKEFRYYIEQIVSKGVSKGINPAVVISIWWGEQEFLFPEKAFGYKYYDSGTAKEVLNGTVEERWQKQLNGVYSVIGDAINNTGNYTQPAGENIITRLFYNYATAMQEQYKTNRVWSQSYSHSQYGNPYYKRFNIIKLLNPNLVVCESFGGIGIASGNFACPADIEVAEASAESGWGEVAIQENYKTGTYDGHEGYDLFATRGATIKSVSNGKVVRVSIDNDGDGQSSTSVTIEETSSIFWYYTHLRAPTVSVGDIVNKGDKIAEVGKYVRGKDIIDHLHLAISKRLNDRSTSGGYNWEAWYYPYEFLRLVPCLQPPLPNEVSYP